MLSNDLLGCGVHLKIVLFYEILKIGDGQTDMCENGDHYRQAVIVGRSRGSKRELKLFLNSGRTKFTYFKRSTHLKFGA